MLSIYPNDEFTFSIGESIVYSDRLQPIYFIPVLFFRAADHYLSSKNTTAVQEMHKCLRMHLIKILI